MLTLLDNWVTVPTNSTITIHNQTVLIHPIIDEFYNATPSFKRSSAFVQTTGQMTTEMAQAQLKAAYESPIDAHASLPGQLEAAPA